MRSWISAASETDASRCGAIGTPVAAMRRVSQPRMPRATREHQFVLSVRPELHDGCMDRGVLVKLVEDGLSVPRRCAIGSRSGGSRRLPRPTARRQPRRGDAATNELFGRAAITAPQNSSSKVGDIFAALNAGRTELPPGAGAPSYALLRKRA